MNRNNESKWGYLGWPGNATNCNESVSFCNSSDAVHAACPQTCESQAGIYNVTANATLTEESRCACTECGPGKKLVRSDGGHPIYCTACAAGEFKAGTDKATACFQK